MGRRSRNAILGGLWQGALCCVHDPELGPEAKDVGYLQEACRSCSGGVVKGATSFGAESDFGMKAVENPVYVHDVHATILHLLRLDHERLTLLTKAVMCV